MSSSCPHENRYVPFSEPNCAFENADLSQNMLHCTCCAYMPNMNHFTSGDCFIFALHTIEIAKCFK